MSELLNFTAWYFLLFSAAGHHDHAMHFPFQNHREIRFIEEDLVLLQPSLPQQVIKYVLKHVLDPGKLIPRAGSFVVIDSKFRQADIKTQTESEKLYNYDSLQYFPLYSRPVPFSFLLLCVFGHKFGEIGNRKPAGQSHQRLWRQK
jgi:hypothetical protein